MINGTKYKTNYERAASYFLGTMAERPKSSERAAAYDYLTTFYKEFAENVSDIGYKPTGDVWFEAWEQQKGREKDIKAIRGSLDKLEGLVAELFNLVDRGELYPGGIALAPDSKPGRALSKLLAFTGVGIEEGKLLIPAETAKGLKELCEISKNNIVHITDGPKEDKAYFLFSHGVFDPKDNWIAKAFDNYLGAKGRLVKLCGELEARGYERVDNIDGKKVGLNYVKQHGKKIIPLKAAWADTTRSGIEVSFEELKLEPCFLWLRMPLYKSILERAEELPEGVAKFLADNTKTCDGCRYCVQTDKTNTRPLASLSVNGKKKCPYYPAFSMNWRTLPQELADNIVAVIDAIGELGI